MLVAARRILTSAGKGPSHGVLVMGRYLDAAAVDALAQSLRFSIALCGVTATRDTVGSRVMPAGSHDVVTVDTPFSDIDGKPAFALRMTLPRDIYAQGVRTTDVFTMLTVIVGIAFVVLSVFLLRFFVLNRTERLGRGIAEIARSKDFSKRIPAAGNDELTHLAEDVNDLLECVVASRRDLAHAHQEIQDMSQELRKLEQTQFKAVLDEMGDAVLVCDGAWLIREANRAAMALLSLPAARGNAMTHLYEHFDVSVAPEALVAEDATHIRFDVVRPESPGAKALYFEAVMDVIKSPSGASVRRVLVLRDVTISRREEKIKRDFLGLVSHKLRTPVTVIGENAEMLTDASIAGELNDIQRPMVEDIIDQTRVLRSLIEKLLSFAEMGGTHRAMLDDRIELESYLKARAERFLKTMTKERAEIIVACPSDAVLLRTNRMCVDLIIDNLIENAVKFGDKERTVVRLAVSFDIRGIALEVSDNGPGIPPEDIAHVFSAFHQIEKGFTGQVSGVGLGLALVKRLVTACAGSIEMRSELGKGTVFTMVFPSA
jgi:signal transduction histidine kinase